MANTSSIYKKKNFSFGAAGAQLSNLHQLLLSLPVDGTLRHVCVCKLLSGTCPCWRSNLFPSVHSVKTSSKPAGGFMRTCAAGCLSTPLTSQMVGWTWTRSESESSSLLCHAGVPLAAPHLSVTFCLRYICAASVSHPGPSPAKMTVSDVALLSYVPVWPNVIVISRVIRRGHRRIHAPLQSQQTGGFIGSSNHFLYQQTCERVSVHGQTMYTGPPDL